MPEETIIALKPRHVEALAELAEAAEVDIQEVLDRVLDSTFRGVSNECWQAWAKFCEQRKEPPECDT